MLPMVLNLWRSSSLWDSSSHLCKGTSLLMFHGTSKQCSAPNPSCKEKASWKKLQPISINVTTALSVRELESGMHRKKKNSLPESLQTIFMNGLAGDTILRCAGWIWGHCMETYIGQLDRGPAQDEPAFTSFLRAIKRDQKNLSCSRPTTPKAYQRNSLQMYANNSRVRRWQDNSAPTFSSRSARGRLSFRYKNRRIASGCSQKDSFQKIKPNQ